MHGRGCVCPRQGPGPAVCWCKGHVRVGATPCAPRTCTHGGIPSSDQRAVNVPGAPSSMTRSVWVARRRPVSHTHAPSVRARAAGTKHTDATACERCRGVCSVGRRGAVHVGAVSPRARMHADSGSGSSAGKGRTRDAHHTTAVDTGRPVVDGRAHQGQRGVCGSGRNERGRQNDIHPRCLASAVPSGSLSLN